MNRNQRTMLKLSASEESVSLRTISRGFRSPQRFIVLGKELQELEEKRYFVARISVPLWKCTWKRRRQKEMGIF